KPLKRCNFQKALLLLRRRQYDPLPDGIVNRYHTVRKTSKKVNRNSPVDMHLFERFIDEA
ncbi:MAG: hypothetical protein M0P01_12560, partial [Treponema sp.]|nr:hypothetical protein [Treponema sp.]